MKNRAFVLMRNAAFTFLCMLAAGIALLPAVSPASERAPEAAAATATPIDAAEYALRWDPRDGGPASAEAALEKLARHPTGRDRCEIRYVEVATPADAPAGFSPIVRVRRCKKKTDVTFKYRGAVPLPRTLTLAEWTCPLAPSAEKKDEADVTFSRSGETRKVYSRSCTVKRKDGPVHFPPELNARPKGCTVTVLRLTSGSLKVEEWRFADGTTLVEVSRQGRDTAADQAQFRDEIVAVLLRAGALPLDRSKTELSEQCR